jgi:hypothetical protein
MPTRSPFNNAERSSIRPYARLDSFRSLTIPGIARLVPKRNIETWILCLNNERVEETPDYKRTRDDWTELIPTAASALYAWTRPNATVPPSCVESLQIGIEELQKIGLAEQN